jgi:PAS domain S-box-containing protein
VRDRSSDKDKGPAPRARDPRAQTGEQMIGDGLPAPRSDVWPAPTRPSIEPPPGSRPSIEPPRLGRDDGSSIGVSLERALWAVASVSQAEHGGATEEGLVRSFVDALAVVAPEALVLVRLIEPKPSGVGSVLGFAYANGKLIEARRDVLELSRRSAVTFGVSEEAAQAASTKLVSVTGAYFAVGDPEQAGSPLLDVPLVESGALFGIVSIEEPRPGAARESTTLIATLASLLGASLRNARLERAAMFFRDYLAQTLEHASAPIFVLDRTRMVRSANRAALLLLGASRSDVLGKDFALMLPEADQERALPALAQAFSGRATSALELDVLRNDREAARVSWNVAPIYDEEGDARAVVVIGRDLTEVHHLEEQILHTDKLATLGQLAAGIVHELNNPLTSITVYGEYLHAKSQRAGADPGDVEKLRRIVEGATRMTRFTRDLVTYARPSNEEETALSIREVALEGARFCEHVLNECNVVLTTDFDADLAPISGVRGQLHQVFVNLVTNASQALAPQKGGIVHIEAHRATARSGEDEVVVRVRDNGPGIAVEHLNRIFEPFFSTKGEGRGTGLGLSIVRKIVVAHRGTLEVTTSHVEGQSGTTFELRFPSI